MGNRVVFPGLSSAPKRTVPFLDSLWRPSFPPQHTFLLQRQSRAPSVNVGVLGLTGTKPGSKCCHNSLPHCACCYAAPLAPLRRVSPLFRTPTARSHRPVSRERMATRTDSVRTSRGWLIRHTRVLCSPSSIQAVHVRSFSSIIPLLCATNLQILLAAWEIYKGGVSLANPYLQRQSI